MFSTKCDYDDQIKEEMGWPSSKHGEIINIRKSYVCKPEGKLSLERPRRKLEEYIKINICVTRMKGADRILLFQDRTGDGSLCRR